MVDHLKMPQAFAGAGIERQQTVTEQIGSVTIGAIKVVLRAGGRRIHDAALLVDRELAPHIRPAHALPGIFRPRVVSKLARTRDRVKGPPLLPGAHVESPYIAGS